MTPDEDAVVAVLAGTIPTPDNTKIHDYLFPQNLQYQNNILKYMPSLVFQYCVI